MQQTPAFIAFTGVDSRTPLDRLVDLSARYPIEWGILIDDAQAGAPLFPDAAARAGMLDRRGLRWAAHVCGEEASRIANSPAEAKVGIEGFQRVQVNHSRAGSTTVQVANTAGFGRRKGVRTLLQCSGAFPADTRVDWLFDVSFGTGVAPGAWPALAPDGPFCGFSGGINPGNVARVVAQISASADDLYWIDMESGVRTDGWLDLDKCEAVCRAIYR